MAAWTGTLGNVQSRTARIRRGAATWTTAQDVSPATGFWSHGVQVALSAHGGTAMAVWVETDLGFHNNGIRARTATISGGAAAWASGPKALSGVDSYAPHVAISSQGTTAVVVWTKVSSSGTGNAQSRAASIGPSSVTWSSKKALSAPTELTSIAASDVALSANGTMAVAVWSIGSVLSRTASLTAGVPTWRKPTQLVSAKGGGPLVGLSRDGTTAVSVWNRFDGTGRLATYLQSASAFAN